MTQIIEIWQPSNGINIDYTLYQVSVDETYNFNFTGTINIENLTVNGTLTATLPLTSDGSINISGNDISINLANANTWTGEQTFEYGGTDLYIGPVDGTSNGWIFGRTDGGRSTVAINSNNLGTGNSGNTAEIEFMNSGIGYFTEVLFVGNQGTSNINDRLQFYYLNPSGGLTTGVKFAIFGSGEINTVYNTLDDGSGKPTFRGLATFNAGITGTGNTGALTAGTGILGTANTWTAEQTIDVETANASLFTLKGGTAASVFSTNFPSASGHYYANALNGDIAFRNENNYRIGWGFSGASGSQDYSLLLTYPYAVSTKNNTLDDGSTGNMSVADSLTVGGRIHLTTAPLINQAEYDNTTLNLSVASGGTYVIGGGTQCSTGNNGSISFRIMLVQDTYNGSFFKLTIYGGGGTVVGTGIVNGGYSSVASANMYNFGDTAGTLGYYCLIQGEIRGLTAYQAYQFQLTNQYSQTVKIYSINAVFTGA